MIKLSEFGTFKTEMISKLSLVSLIIFMVWFVNNLVTVILFLDVEMVP